MKVTETDEKYLKVLKELHNVLSYTNRISMNGFCDKNKISKMIPQVLQKGGVIKCTKKGKSSEWVWESIPPNMSMVNEMKRRLNESTQLSRLKKVESKKVDSPVIIKEVEKKVNTFEFSFLWGLIKIKK